MSFQDADMSVVETTLDKNETQLYVVTAQKPTSVTHSVSAHFTGPFDNNLILVKATHLEIYVVQEDGLKLMFESRINGRVTVMLAVKPKNRGQDVLFLLNERYHCCLLSFDRENWSIITDYSGDIMDRIGRPDENGHLGVSDPDCRVLVLRLYTGMLKTFIFDAKYTLKDIVNFRVEELQIIDMTFLHGCSRPTLVLIYEDQYEKRHLKCYEVHTKDKELKDHWSLNNVEGRSQMLISVLPPYGGVIIIGEQIISYYAGEGSVVSVAMRPCLIKAFERLDADGKRYLLGDHSGNLYVLLLECNENASQVTGLNLERLGEVSIPSSISHLDDGTVFIGSTYGDSQLIRLISEKNECNDYLNVLETYPNIGPIVDFVVVDAERQGQSQIVTCSGAFKDGSLRIIRNGVGVTVLATLDLPDIKGIWSLHPESDSMREIYLVISFVAQTKLLAFTGEEAEEIEMAGFSHSEPSLLCSDVTGGGYLQVTESEVKVINSNTHTVDSSWRPPSGNLNMAAFNGIQLIVSANQKTLVYFEIHEGRLIEKRSLTMDHEIACLDLSSLRDVSMAQFCAVGLWTDVTVRLLSLPGLELLKTEYLGGDYIARSILLASLEGQYYLFCGLGDGHLISYRADPKTLELTEKKQVSLGRQPLSLRSFKTRRCTNVFACSDRPTIIYSTNGKLAYAQVNVKDVYHVATMNSTAFPDALALGTPNAVIIGNIDDIQRLHVQTIPLKETPRRICFQESSRVFLLATAKYQADIKGLEDDAYSLRLLDCLTYETLDVYHMSSNEAVLSIESLVFADDNNAYYVVGTTFVWPTEDEPTRGRLLVMQVTEARQLRLISEYEVKGAPYQVCNFKERLLVAYNNRLNILRWTDVDRAKQLVFECGVTTDLISLHIRVHGDFIIVGDLMKSISVYLYRSNECTIDMVAKDPNPAWTTAIEVITDEFYIGTENNHNMYVLRRQLDAELGRDRSRLFVSGEFHVGTLVNKLRHGSLIMMTPELQNIGLQPQLIYGTIDGSLGIIASLQSAELFSILQGLQNNMSFCLKNFDGVSHAAFRSFTNDRRTTPSHGFIDGDLIEMFLNLPIDRMQEIVEAKYGGSPLKISVTEVARMIEDFARIH